MAAMTGGFQYPTRLWRIMDVLNFVARPPMKGKGYCEWKKNTTVAVYGDFHLKITQIYATLGVCEGGRRRFWQQSQGQRHNKEDDAFGQQ